MENNHIQLDASNLSAISDDVRKGMIPVFDELRNSIQSENLEGLSKWYMKTGKTKDETLSEIANKVVEKMMNCFPQNYVKLVIENINIDTKDEKSSNVKFDVAFELDPLKFYVEFLIRVNGNYVTSGRVRLEINMSGSFKELKFQYERNGNKQFHLGQLDSSVSISIVGMPFVRSIEPHEIINKQFTADLSRYHIG